jgi:hypothetical protein
VSSAASPGGGSSVKRMVKAPAIGMTPPHGAAMD